MSRLANDACLAVASALITSFTYKVRDWTGIRESTEWTLGAAVILMIVWLVVRRKEGIRTGLLLANLVGIGLGLLIGGVAHRLELGRPLGPSLIFVVPTGVCIGLYLRLEKREREGAEEVARFRQEIAEIGGLPEEAAKALQTKVDQLGPRLAQTEIRLGRLYGRASILISLGMLATIVALPGAISPEPKPLRILISLAILALGFVWFAKLALMKLGERSSSD